MAMQSNLSPVVIFPLKIPSFRIHFQRRRAPFVPSANFAGKFRHVAKTRTSSLSWSFGHMLGEEVAHPEYRYSTRVPVAIFFHLHRTGCISCIVRRYQSGERCTNFSANFFLRENVCVRRLSRNKITGPMGRGMFF